jgi:hypothetical protein
MIGPTEEDTMKKATAITRGFVDIGGVMPLKKEVLC